MECSELKKRINDVINEKIYNENPVFPNKGLLMEVTNLCNDSCIFCFNKNMTREKGVIDSQFAKRILKEAYQLGMREVGFYTTGEPLINKNLEDYILEAKNIGYQYIYITTNGSLANLDRILNLIACGLNSIKFSINAIDREAYKFIHGKDDFENVIMNLKNLYKYKKENNLSINIFVSYIKTKYTDKDEIEIKKFFDGNCDEIVIMNVENQGGLQKNAIDLLMPNSFAELNTTKKLPCSYPFKSVIITREGYLTACCLDFQNYLAYADLNKTTLSEAWNNEIIRKLRREQLQHDASDTICANCVYNKDIVPKPIVTELATPFEYNDNISHSCIIKRISKYK